MILRHYLFIIALLLSGTDVSANSNFVVLDIGEGQSILISNKIEGILIDLGHFGKTTDVLHKLKKYKVKKLNYFVLTHLHPDHASGYFRIREEFPLTLVYDNCHKLTDKIEPDSVRWVHQALNNDPLRRCLKLNGQLSFKGVEIKVLWPEDPHGSNLNHNSLVLLVNYKNRKILIMGDADKQVEQILIKNKTLPRDIDIVVIGHHGAIDATSQAFLDWINAKFAVISVNKNNIRDYPSSAVLTKLKKKGITVYRTDIDGDVVF